MKFVLGLSGSPISKPRPRSGKNGHFYNPKEKEEELAKKEITEQLKLVPLFTLPVAEKPISLHLCYFFKYPTGYSKKRRAQEKWKVSRPDADNLIKFTKDVLNGIIYQDDSQVVRLLGEKRWSHNEAKTLIYIEILE